MAWSSFEHLPPFVPLSLEHIQAAIAQLELLGTLDRKDDQLTLTPMGRKMAAFPLEPRFAKVNDPLSSVPLSCPLQVSHPRGVAPTVLLD